MTYSTFHLVFTIPLLVLVVFLNRKNSESRSRKSIYGTLLLCFLALSYTTPWDSYLIREQIWTYSPGNVIGSLWHIPYEEYFFFFIQTIIGCLFTAFILRKSKARSDHQLKIGKINLIALVVAWGSLGVAFTSIAVTSPWRYFALIFYWAVPILCLQWSLGLPILLKEKTTWFASVVLLTSYFWFADSVAILKNIWSFPESTISGVQLFGILPIEEALFFLVTNLMVVQGYILFTRVDFKKTELFT